MKNINTEFSILFDYIQKLHYRYLNVLSIFNIYDTFNELSSFDMVGYDNARQNVDIMNDFKYFFNPINEACRCYMLIEIQKFFDTDNDSLSLNNILRYSRRNMSKLTKSDFLQYHKNRVILPELLQTYKELSITDLNVLQIKIKQNNITIKNLRAYRNKYLSHDDIKKIKINITKQEIKDILNIIKDFIDLFYLKIDFASNVYKNFEEESRSDVKRLIECLIRYESNKIEELSNIQYRLT